MKTQPFLVGLTIINLALLSFLLLSRTAPVLATTGVSVLRGSALEIVDSRGRVRASIKVQAGDPETVMLRLIDQNGRPEVKIGASDEGGGLSLIGEADATQLLLQAEGSQSSLRLTNKAGRKRLIEP